MFNENLYVVYSRTTIPPEQDYRTHIYLLKLPIAASTKFENQYYENEVTKNDLGSMLINDTYSFNSPSEVPIKLFEPFSVEPEETFYDPLKFYDWTQPTVTRTSKRTGQEVSVE